MSPDSWRFSALLRLRNLAAVLAVGLTVWALIPVMTSPAKPLFEQPGPDSIEYADGAWQLGHGHAYVTFYNERTKRFGTRALRPRYPFGTSLVLAPFAAVLNTFPHSLQIGSQVISALYVIVMVAAAWAVGDSIAAALVAVMLAISPFPRESAAYILSDALGALLAVAILFVLGAGRGNRSAAVAGLLAGMMVCVRLLGIASIPAVLLAVSGRRRWWALAGAIPFSAALGIYQWNYFGSPFRSGYSYYRPQLREFGWSYILGHTAREGPFIYADRGVNGLLGGICPCGAGGAMRELPNLAFYPSLLAGLFWVFAPPLMGLVGFVAMLIRRSTAAARYAIVLVLLNAGLLIVYWYAAARFVAPAASVLTVYAGVGISRVLHRLAGWSTSVWRDRGTQLGAAG